MSNNKRFENPPQAVIMGSYLRYEPERKVLRGGGVLPAMQREVLILCWPDEGRVREGTLAGSRLFGLDTGLHEVREWRTAGDWCEIPAALRVWHGTPDRTGEQFVAETNCPEGFEYGGEIVGEFVRFVPVSKSGRRKPRLIPFVVVRGRDNHEYVCRVQGGQEWETTPDPLEPQLQAAHTRLMAMYPPGYVSITPFGRGGYWQVVAAPPPQPEGAAPQAETTA